MRRATGTVIASCVIVVGMAACGSSSGSAAGPVRSTTTSSGACSAQSQACGTDYASSAAVGNPAPKLSGEALDGSGVVDLASLRGKPTVVVIWSPPCPHCQAECRRSTTSPMQ